MKIIQVCLGWNSQTQIIKDNDLADAAVSALKEAMKSYDRFGNDKEKTVTVKTGPGSEATFRISEIVSVTVDDCALSEETVIENEVRTQRLKSIIAARLAPAAE